MENDKRINELLKVCILIYDGVYLLDFTGPLEVFFDTELEDHSKAFEVFLVAPIKKEIKAHSGTIIIPDYDITNCPNPDILVIPGGNLNLVKEYPIISEFILNIEKHCKIIMSVCTGAFILAEIGLLNNKKVTTWFGAKDKLKNKYPDIILSDDRFTVNAKIITTTGISAGIDGSLYIVKQFYGEKIMKNTAKYIEWFQL